MALSVEDRLAIQELYARYNHAIDLGDPKGWADTFSPDGVFESPNTGALQGSAALEQFARNAGGAIQGRHWTNNLVLDGSGDRAKGSCYLILLDVGKRPANLLITGLYRDELAKSSAGWRFLRRSVEVDGA